MTLMCLVRLTLDFTEWALLPHHLALLSRRPSLRASQYSHSNRADAAERIHSFSWVECWNSTWFGMLYAHMRSTVWIEYLLFVYLF